MDAHDNTVIDTGVAAIADMNSTRESERHKQAYHRISRVIWILVIALIIMLRLVALDSDAYRRLSWSSGLFTDEGFYIHNARNLILFGRLRTDGFNNMLIMPTIHYLQVAVFYFFGVGALQARMISVVLSLLTLIVFYLALRLAFGQRTAVYGCLFLGLDHINLLYNRMALMDTPAAFVMVTAFYAWVAANACLQRDADRRTNVRLLSWLWVTGALLALAYATRGLAALLIPAPFAILCGSVRTIGVKQTGVRCLAIAVGFACVLIPFWILWLAPNRLELARLNHHYISVQLVPHSWAQAMHNIRDAFVGNQRGLFPYLFRHSPVQFALALFWCASTGAGLLSASNRTPESGSIRAEDGKLVLADSAYRSVAVLLGFWLIVFWLFMTCVNYAPSRYYVIFYPALAALSGVALVELDALRTSLMARSLVPRAGGAFLLFLGCLALLEHFERPNILALTLVAALSVLLSFLVPTILKHQGGSKIESRRLALALTMGWAIVNAGWLGNWLTHLTYTQRDADRWLARNLPTDSILFGAFAPGLCLNNHFQVVSVIDKLCNYKHPIEGHPAAHRYVLILDDVKPWTRWKEPWWVKTYPEIVSARPPIHHFSGLGRPIFDVATYAVPSDHP